MISKLRFEGILRKKTPIKEIIAYYLRELTTKKRLKAKKRHKVVKEKKACKNRG
jgi:hypothetical protein